MDGPKICAVCNEPITSGGFLNIGDQYFHANCFKCAECTGELSGGYFPKDGKYFCKGCYEEKFAQKCAACGKPLSGASVVFDGQNYHKEC